MFTLTLFGSDERNKDVFPVSIENKGCKTCYKILGEIHGRTRVNTVQNGVLVWTIEDDFNTIRVHVDMYFLGEKMENIHLDRKELTNLQPLCNF